MLITVYPLVGSLSLLRAMPRGYIPQGDQRDRGKLASGPTPIINCPFDYSGVGLPGNEMLYTQLLIVIFVLLAVP